MGARFATAPVWFPAAFQGVFYAVWMSVWSRLSDHESWARTMISGVIMALAFGGVMWFAGRKERRANAVLTEGLTAEQRRAVARAVATGTPPADPTLRARAAAIVRHQLAEDGRYRTLTLVVFAMFLALSAGIAASGSPWYWPGAAVFAGMLIWVVRNPGTLRRKLAALEPPAAAAPKTRV